MSGGAEEEEDEGEKQCKRKVKSQGSEGCPQARTGPAILLPYPGLCEEAS